MDLLSANAVGDLLALALSCSAGSLLGVLISLVFRVANKAQLSYWRTLWDCRLSLFLWWLFVAMASFAFESLAGALTGGAKLSLAVKCPIAMLISAVIANASAVGSFSRAGVLRHLPRGIPAGVLTLLRRVESVTVRRVNADVHQREKREAHELVVVFGSNTLRKLASAVWARPPASALTIDKLALRLLLHLGRFEVRRRLKELAESSPTPEVRRRLGPGKPRESSDPSQERADSAKPSRGKGSASHQTLAKTSRRNGKKPPPSPGTGV